MIVKMTNDRKCICSLNKIFGYIIFKHNLVLQV